MVPDTQVVSFGRNIRVYDLVVKELRRLRLPSNTPVVEVQKPAEEGELALLIEGLDVHEIAELTGERFHPGAESDRVCIHLAAD